MWLWSRHRGYRGRDSECVVCGDVELLSRLRDGFSQAVGWITLSRGAAIVHSVVVLVFGVAVPISRQIDLCKAVVMSFNCLYDFADTTEPKPIPGGVNGVKSAPRGRNKVGNMGYGSIGEICH